jgi:hypothetical protein
MGFDNKSRLSITEIIPGHLSAIHRELAIMRTGDPNIQPQVYDFEKGRFIGKTDMAAKIRGNMMEEASRSYYQYLAGNTANSMKGEAELTPENEIELKLFLGKLARIPNMSYTPERIVELKAYQNLSPSVRSVVDKYFEQMEGDEKETKLKTFDKDMTGLKRNMPSLSQSLDKYVKMGYGDVLEDMGLGTMRNGRLTIDEDNFDNFIDESSRVRSDINVKEAIRKMKPEDLLRSVKERFKGFRSGAKGHTPRSAYEAFKKTPLYNWFYKKGVGDNQEHSGPMAQDVARNFGEEVAPGGKEIDLQSMNGATMAAVQHLGERVENMESAKGVKGGYLGIISENTTKIRQILESKGGVGIRLGRGDGQTPPPSGGEPNIDDGSYRGTLTNLAAAAIALITKVGGDVFGSVGTIFGSLKKNAIEPGTKFAKDLWADNKDKLQETFRELVTKAGNLAQGALDWSRNLLTNRLPKGFDFLKKGFSKLRNKFSDKFNEVRDLYLEGSDTPVILANKLRMGEYIDAATGKAVMTMDELAAAKGDIVDKAGNVVLLAQDRAKGLYDRHGEKFTSSLKMMGQAVLGMGLEAGAKLLGGLAELKKHGLGAFGKIKGAVAGGWKELLDRGLGGFTIHDRKNHEVLVDIRSILLGEENEVRDRLKKAGQKMKAGLNGVMGGGVGGIFGGAAPTMVDGASYTSEPSPDATAAPTERYAGGGLAGLFSGAQDLYQSAKDRFFGQKQNGTVPQYRQVETAGGINYRRPGGGVPAPTPASGGRFSRLRQRLSGALDRASGGRAGMILGGLSTAADFLGSAVSKGASAAAGAAGFLGDFGDGRRPEDPEAAAARAEGEESAIRQQKKALIPENQRAWNDKDGSGSRDGSVEERQEKLQAIADSRKKKGAQASLDPKYKSTENIIDKMMRKAGGVFDTIKNGATSLFALGGNLLTSIPGVGAGIAKLGKGAAELFAKIRGGAAANTARAAGGALVQGAVAAGKTVLTTGARLALTKALPAVALAGAKLAGAAVLSVGSVLFSPLILKAAAVVGVGYGVWKLYKGIASRFPNDYEHIRMAQYGLPPKDAATRSHYSTLFSLEAYLEDGRLVYTGDSVRLNTQKIKVEEMLDLFGIDKEDTTRADAYSTWFHGRFLPFYLKHIEVLYRLNPKLKLTQIDKLKAAELVSYLDETRMASGPYSATATPFQHYEALEDTSKWVEDFSKELLEKARKKLPKKRETTVVTQTGSGDPEAFKKGIDGDKKTPDGQAPKTPVDKIAPYKAQVANTDKRALHGNPSTSHTGSAAVNDEPTEYGEDGGNAPRSNIANDAGSTKLPSGGGTLTVAGGQLSSGQQGAQFIRASKEANLDRLHPKTRELFFAMAEEFGRSTGRPLNVTSGWRDSAKQAQLYRTLPKGQAAPPGRSLHEFGLAIDIDPKDADLLEELGLMRKYGFTRPVGGEKWHLEPAGIQRNLDEARQNPAIRDQMVAASVWRGGGGVALLPGFKKYGRDRNYAMAMMNASSKAVDGTLKPAANDETMVAERDQASQLPSPQAVDNKMTLANGGDFSSLVPPSPDTEKLSNSGSGRIGGAGAGLVGIGAPNAAPGSSGAGAADGAGGAGPKLADGDIQQKVAEAAKRVGVDPNVMLAMAAVESDFNPNARAKTSSAGGLMQFLDGTWREQLAKHGRKHGLAPNASKFDPDAAALLGAEYLKTNLNSIRGLSKGNAVTDAYLTHFLGPGGAKKFLSMSGETPAASQMPDAAKSNKSIFYGQNGNPLTADEVYQGITKRLEKKTARYGLQLPTTSAKPEMGGGQGLQIGGGTQGVGGQLPSAPAASAAKTEESPKMLPSSSGGIFIPRDGNTPLARERREQGQSMAGPNLQGVEASLTQSVKIQQESLDILKSILAEVKAEKVAEVLAAAVSAAMAANKPNPLKEADQKNMGRRNESGRSALDLRRNVA